MNKPDHLESLDFDHLTGLTVARVWEDGASEVWLHMRDGSAVEIAAEPGGGFFIFIHRSDSLYLKEAHERQIAVLH